MRVKAFFKGRTKTKSFCYFYFEVPGINGTIYAREGEEIPKEIIIELPRIPKIPKKAMENKENLIKVGGTD